MSAGHGPESHGNSASSSTGMPGAMEICDGCRGAADMFAGAVEGIITGLFGGGESGGGSHGH